MLLKGVDVQRGRDLVTLNDGRQAELSTVAVETWHIGERGESQVSPQSSGQFHEGDTYAIRWSYCLTALGVCVCVCVLSLECQIGRAHV